MTSMPSCRPEYNIFALHNWEDLREAAKLTLRLTVSLATAKEHERWTGYLLLGGGQQGITIQPGSHGDNPQHSQGARQWCLVSC